MLVWAQDTLGCMVTHDYYRVKTVCSSTLQHVEVAEICDWSVIGWRITIAFLENWHDIKGGSRGGS